MALTVLAAYDIREDATRARLAAILQCYGDRIQKSVFVLHADADDLTLVTARADALIDHDVDSFILVPVCATCWDGIIQRGQTQVTPPVLYWAAL